MNRLLPVRPHECRFCDLFMTAVSRTLRVREEGSLLSPSGVPAPRVLPAPMENPAVAARTRGPSMSSIEERVAYLEGRMEDHTAATADLRTSVREFRTETGRQFDDVRGEMNRQFADVRGETNRRFELINEKVDRHFTWIVGLQVTSLLAVVSAIAGLYLR